MTLSELIKGLQKLEETLGSDIQVFGSDNEGGSRVQPVTGVSDSDYFGCEGPFDIEEGTTYISLSLGY